MDAGFVARGSYVFAGVGAGVDWLLVFASVWVVWGGEMSSRAKNWGRVVLIVGLWFVRSSRLGIRGVVLMNYE